MIKSKELDKFYTKPEIAQKCTDKLLNVIKKVKLVDPTFVELTAGDGAFSKLISCRAYDLYPEAPGIQKLDATQWVAQDQEVVIFGNPPFGRSSKLALEIFRNAAQQFQTKVIAWIIPRTWRRASVHSRIPQGWELLSDNLLPDAAFTLDGKNYNVKCTFQIWVREELVDWTGEKPLNEDWIDTYGEFTVNGETIHAPHTKTFGLYAMWRYSVAHKIKIKTRDDWKQFDVKLIRTYPTPAANPLQNEDWRYEQIKN